jgi:short subunit dehydrogenase-like uncharacterized protein
VPPFERVITLLGATGFTGRLIAAELARRGMRFALAGRSAARLQTLAAQVGQPETLIVDVTHAPSLERLAQSSRVIINCVGPFVDFGEPVVRAAIAGGAHYLDTTGEQPFIKKVRAHDAAARASKVAVVPAMAFEVAVADCAVAVAAEGYDEVHAVEITYAVPLHPSNGTRRTALRMLQGDGYAYVGARWVREPLARRQIEVDFPPPLGRVPAVSFPSAEVITVPMHQTVREVRTFMAIPRAAAHALGLLRPVLPAAAWVAGALGGLVLGDDTDGPDERTRTADRFQIAIDVRGLRGGRTRTRRLLAAGTDPYGLTAVIAAEGAARLSRDDFARSGVLPPAAAVEPRDFLKALKTTGLTTTVHDEG